MVTCKLTRVAIWVTVSFFILASIRMTCSSKTNQIVTDKQRLDMQISCSRQWRVFIVQINYINIAGCNGSCPKGIFGGRGVCPSVTSSVASRVLEELEVVHARPVDEAAVEGKLQRRAEENVVIQFRHEGGGEVDNVGVSLALETCRVSSHGEEVAQVEVTVGRQEVVVIGQVEELKAHDHGTDVQGVATCGGRRANRSGASGTGAKDHNDSLVHTSTTVTTYLGEFISYWPTDLMISNARSLPGLAAIPLHITTGEGLSTVRGEESLHQQRGGVASTTLSCQISKDCMIKPVRVTLQDITDFAGLKLHHRR